LVQGIGIDIVKIERIAEILDRSGKLYLKKLFTPREISHCSRAESQATYFAGLFAAKESILKALGIGWNGVRGTDIEVRQDLLGAPLVSLKGELAKLAKSRTVSSVFVSISYDGNYAIAVSILEDE
jgi:holo-[acyl-carrier protein] synthase